MSRAFLELVARTVNVDAASYANDSKLEQAVIYALKNTGGDAVQATGTLTASGVFSDGDTITIGDRVYTMKTTLTASTTANEILIGADAATSLDNIKSAINLTGTPGTDYGSNTTANILVTATTNTDTTQVVQAIEAGTVGNAIATTETGANSAWGGANLSGGADGTYYIGESPTAEAQISGGANV